MTDKIELGNMLLDMAPREKVSTVASAAIWALGRIGARRRSYGPLNTVISGRHRRRLGRTRDESLEGAADGPAGADATRP